MSEKRPLAYRALSWLVSVELVLTVLVILGGAVVRATGSGAGCGEHWPLCNGQAIPLSPSVETVIEFTHRITSGLSLVVFVVIFFWARRYFKKGHAVRSWLNVALVSFLLEAAIGAFLVLKSLVATDTSYMRAFVIAFHLVNTYVLLTGLTAILLHLAGKLDLKPSEIPVRWKGLFAAWLVVGAMGAVVALGNTLFPSQSLGHGLMQDFASESHPLVRLRILHPIFAVCVSAVTLLFTLPTLPGENVPYAKALRHVIFCQIGLGFLNWILLAPLWIQLSHLLVADITWIFLACFCLSSSKGQWKVTAPSSLGHRT